MVDQPAERGWPDADVGGSGVRVEPVGRVRHEFSHRKLVLEGNAERSPSEAINTIGHPDCGWKAQMDSAAGAVVGHVRPPSTYSTHLYSFVPWQR